MIKSTTLKFKPDASCLGCLSDVFEIEGHVEATFLDEILVELRLYGVSRFQHDYFVIPASIISPEIIKEMESEFWDRTNDYSIKSDERYDSYRDSVAEKEGQ